MTIATRYFADALELRAFVEKIAQERRASHVRPDGTSHESTRLWNVEADLMGAAAETAWALELGQDPRLVVRSDKRLGDLGVDLASGFYTMDVKACRYGAELLVECVGAQATKADLVLFTDYVKPADAHLIGWQEITTIRGCEQRPSTRGTHTNYVVPRAMLWPPAELRAFLGIGR